MYGKVDKHGNTLNSNNKLNNLLYYLHVYKGTL